MAKIKSYGIYAALALSLAVNGYSFLAPDSNPEKPAVEIPVRDDKHETGENDGPYTPPSRQPEKYIVLGYFKVMYPVKFENENTRPAGDDRVGILESVTQEHTSIGVPVPDSVQWKLPFVNGVFGVKQEHIELVGFDYRKVPK